MFDPPYLSTDVGTYNMYWNMADYLDVLNVLKGQFITYISLQQIFNSGVVRWIGRNRDLGNPFENCTKVEFNAHMNYSSSYTDMMLYKKEAA